jgi:ribonuclease HI
MKFMLFVYIDGLAEPNPGVGTYGYAIYEDDEKVATGHGFAGDPVTNNYAEYEGLIKALDAVSKHSNQGIMIRSDSRLLVNQMSGEWKVGKKALRNHDPGSYVAKHQEAIELARKFKRLTFQWIPREKNTEADELSRVAYREELSKRRRS